MQWVFTMKYGRLLWPKDIPESTTKNLCTCGPFLIHQSSPGVCSTQCYVGNNQRDPYKEMYADWTAQMLEHNI